tara:strand:+ start:418 stop:696 length:279 start_codon:yes stop_codon:yes gene_type:complete
MVEHTLKDHGRRIIQVEEGLNKLQVSHAESKVLQTENFRQIREGMVEQHRMLNCLTTQNKGWAGQLRNPQTLIIVVSFIAAMLGIEIIWPTL